MVKSTNPQEMRLPWLLFVEMFVLRDFCGAPVTRYR